SHPCGGFFIGRVCVCENPPVRQNAQHFATSRKAAKPRRGRYRPGAITIHPSKRGPVYALFYPFYPFYPELAQQAETAPEWALQNRHAITARATTAAPRFPPPVA